MCLRFLLLPWCFATKIDWPECPKNPFGVCADLLHIFFTLRYYPDNYGPCRLWELPRDRWIPYYGSSYNPWARHLLRRRVQPFEWLDLFVDKVRCDQHFRRNGIPLPRLLGTLSPGHDVLPGLRALVAANAGQPVVAKPIRGARGRGVYIASLDGDRISVTGSSGMHTASPLRLAEAYMVQDRVAQNEAVSGIYPNAVNTIRMVTLLTTDGNPIIIGSYMRLGTGGAVVDNVNQGGIAVGIDPDSGRMRTFAYDAKGRSHQRHPGTGFVFEGFEVPFWRQVVDVSRRAQLACPFYRLIGLDVALTGSGPVVIEVNANPDLVGLEQKCGPLLNSPRVLAEFSRYGLLFNDAQRALAASALA